MALPTKYVKVFIGRFQPFHNGHLKVLRAAIDTADLVVVVIGSANAPRSAKNPWLWHERRRIIQLSLKPAELAKVHITIQDDFPGSDAEWVRSVKKKVIQEAKFRLGYAKYHITLIGCHKDASTYYLKLYRGWHLDLGPSSEALNATDVRNAYFERADYTYAKNLPPASAAFLYAFRLFQFQTFLGLVTDHLATKGEAKCTRT